jgi:predicted unusual protein kinase regulating ubiquinone biosynthesis (AarF/ABC1/UbiB family)
MRVRKRSGCSGDQDVQSWSPYSRATTRKAKAASLALRSWLTLAKKGMLAMDTQTTRLSRLSQMARFLRLLRLFLWTLWVMYNERRRVMRTQAPGNALAQSASPALIRVLAAFRDAAVKQDVLLIKLGQFLSTRADLLPEQAIAVLASLQDEVPPAPFAYVVGAIESELGKPVEEVFSVLERKATAAASLGQVHKAVLASTGETVAVKIQRPQIEQLVRLDLRALKFVIWVLTRFVDAHHVIDLMGFYNEFERTIDEELDYMREAANAKRFREMFRDDPTIYIPRVYDQYVSRRLLVLEWIEGISIDDDAALDAAGINHLELARRIVNGYFYQFFAVGFFHADPHPGNLFARPGPPGDEPIVTFVDFGMVGSYTQQMRRLMKDAFLAVLARDARALANALTQLGFIGEGADPASIERSMSRLLVRYADLSLGEVREMGLSTILQEIGQLLYGQSLRIPARFAFIGRAVGLLMGLAEGLDPEFNFMEVATPYARTFLGLDAKGMEQTAQQLVGQALAAGRALLTLPQAFEQILSKLEAGELEVTLAGPESRGWGSVRGRRGRRGNGAAPALPGFTWPFMFATSLAGGIVLLADAHQFIVGWFCFALAGLCAVRALVKS